MSLRPEQIEERSFVKRWRGYDVDQVRAFLSEIAADLQTRTESKEIIESAKAEASEMVEAAERAARDRSGEVLTETQARLDQLLSDEREVRKRLEELAEVAEAPAGASIANDAAHISVPPIPDAVEGSLADYLKEAVRNEVGP